MSAIRFFAFATPTSGFAWSSNGTSSTAKPIFSSGPLNFSSASWAPSLMPSPSAAWPPESGLWVAILIVPFPWAATREPAVGQGQRAARATRAT